MLVAIDRERAARSSLVATMCNPCQLGSAALCRVVVGPWRASDASAQTAIYAPNDACTAGGVNPTGCEQVVSIAVGDNGNMAEILATDAGRARDGGLNSLCRRTAGLQLV